MRWTAAVAVATVVAIGGCSSPLPQHQWRSAEDALDVLAARATDIDDLSAVGHIVLIDGRGRSPALNAVIAARPPNHLRLRAWKFHQAVLDLTVNEHGLFVWSSGEAAHAIQAMPGSATVEWLPAIWSMIRGDLFTESPVAMRVRGGAFCVTYPVAGAHVTARIDRRTLTVRRLTVEDDQGIRSSTIDLQRYRMVNGVPWPMRMIARHRGQALDIRLDEVDLAAELPSEAFVPPPRAVRHP